MPRYLQNSMSSRSGPRSARVLRAFVLAQVGLLGVLGSPNAFAGPAESHAATAPLRSAPGGGKVFLTLPEALKLAFPDCEVKKETVFLTEPQQAEVLELVGGGDPVRIVFPYVARDKAGEVVGTAYFDTHKVRALKETLMVVVSPQEQVARIELLAFAEPKEYVPGAKWYGQFLHKPLSDGLNLGRDVRAVTGATLTGRASTRAVRRALAVHQVLGKVEPVPKPVPEPRPEPEPGPGTRAAGPRGPGVR